MTRLAKKNGSPPAVRALRPRPTVAVAPLAVSTENCLAVAGIVPRKLRELLERHGDIPRARVGHTIIIEPAAFYELLARLRESDGEADSEVQKDAEDDQPSSADAVLARLGKTRGAR